MFFYSLRHIVLSKVPLPSLLNFFSEGLFR